MLHCEEVIKLPEGELVNEAQPKSPSSTLNPLPLTVTRVPGEPEFGVRVIEGTVTVKVADAESVAGLPVVVIL
jgi:hypothetical protein